MKSRRRFLTVIAAASVGAACGDEDGTELGAGGFAGVGGSGGDGPEPNLPEGFEAVGNLTGIPVGSLIEALGLDLLFGRDDVGVYAMTSRCTHEQCNMINNEGIVSPGKIRCACHGSEFDSVGVPTMGPASAQLAHFAVFVDENGFIGVNTAMGVDPSTRAAPPA
jgi:nitrite reductase/ring-hydroxylating ferredoxin subunit